MLLWYFFYLFSLCLTLPATLEIFADDRLREIHINHVNITTFTPIDSFNVQTVSVDSEPGDLFEIVIYNKGEKGGLSCVIDIGGVEYTTKEKELWSDTIPDSNRIYIKKSDTHLYGDSYKFPAEVFIGLTNGNNQEFTFLMTFPYKSHCNDKIYSIGNSIIIDMRELVEPEVTEAEIANKLWVVFDTLPMKGSLLLKSNNDIIIQSQQYDINEVIYSISKIDSDIGKEYSFTFHGISLTNDISNTATVTIAICLEGCAQCELPSTSSDWYKQCNRCEEGYHLIYDNSYITCIIEGAEPSDYYLDTEDDMYKQCLNECNHCALLSHRDHSCFHVLPSDQFEYNATSNTYNKLQCDELITPEMQCVTHCPKLYPIKYNYHCYSKCPSSLTMINHTCISLSDINNCIKDIKSNPNDYLSLAPYSIDNDTCKFDIYESSDSHSKINLTQCENVLKEHYAIDTIIIASFNIKNENSITDQIEYLLYDTNGNLLDTSLCNSTIIISYPISNETEIKFDLAYNLSLLGIDIYNPNDPFYNDICYSYSSNGLDVILNDRRNEIYVNVSFCEDDCEYLGIDYTKKVVNCECSIKKEISTTKSNKKSPSPFYQAITDSNIYIIKCYHYFIHWKFLHFNIGFWFFGCGTFIIISTVFAFLCIGMKKIYSKLNDFPKNSPSRRTHKLPTAAFVIESDRSEKEEREKIKISGSGEHLTPIPNMNKILVNKLEIKKFQLNPENSFSSKNTFKNSNMNFFSVKDISNDPFTPTNMPSNRSKESIEIVLSSIESSTKNLIDANKMYFTSISDTDNYSHRRYYENYPFNIAVDIDKRTFPQMIFDIFRQSQNLCRIVYQRSFFELIPIKLSEYIFYLLLTFALNAVFYTDDVISQRYHNKGELSFLTTILKSIYSSLLCFVLSSIVGVLARYYYYLDVLIRTIKDKESFMKYCKRFVSFIKRRIFFFYLIIVALSLFFWYYVTIFCAIYSSSQLSWFKGGWLSSAISLMTSSIISIIVAILRTIALRNNKITLYNISNYILKRI